VNAWIGRRHDEENAVPLSCLRVARLYLSYSPSEVATTAMETETRAEEAISKLDLLANFLKKIRRIGFAGSHVLITFNKIKFNVRVRARVQWTIRRACRSLFSEPS